MLPRDPCQSCAPSGYAYQPRCDSLTQYVLTYHHLSLPSTALEHHRQERRGQLLPSDTNFEIWKNLKFAGKFLGVLR